MNYQSLVGKIMLNKISIFLSFAIGLAVTTSVYAENHWQQRNYIESSFSKIALNSITRYGAKKIIKWSTPINYYFEHRVADDQLHESLTNMHLTHLADITGVNIKQTYNRSQANLVIVFSNEKKMLRDFTQVTGLRASSHLKKITERNTCLAYSTFKASGNIRHATVLVAVDRARANANLITCIVEELSEIMGLPNDSDRVYPSIFNDKSPETLLTGLDYLMLKILYDKRIKAGMSKNQVTPIIRRIITEQSRHNVINNAEREVRKGGLYALLY